MPGYPCEGEVHQTTNCFGLGTCASPELPVWDSNDELWLLSKLATKVKGHDWNAGISIATVHQSAQLIGDNARRIAQAMIALKRFNVREARRILLWGHRNPLAGFDWARYKPMPRPPHRDNLKTLSAEWLALSYGWLPLLQDVESAAKAIAHELHDRTAVTFTVRHGKRVVTDGKHYSFRRVQLKYKLTDSLDGYYGAIQRYGITDVKSMAWELLPWSFAIDWLVPIGTYLEAAHIIPDLRGSYVRSESFGQVGWGSGFGVIQSGKKVVIPQHSISGGLTRTVGTSLNVPLPTFRNPFSSLQRGANQIALAVAQVRKIL